jgi:transposase-like protein
MAETTIKMKRKRPQKFSLAFKRKVIEEYLSGGSNKSQLLRKYKIGFDNAILTWMRQLGYPTVSREKRYIAPIMSKPLTDNNSDKDAELIRLKKELKAMERKLEDEQLRREGLDRMIEFAEKSYKISIRKKPDTK